MKSEILDIIYPKACVGCDAALSKEERSLCWDCSCSMVLLKEPRCRCCGLSVQGKVPADFRCYACIKEVRFFTVARSCYVFEGVMRDMVMRFKYEPALWLRDELVQILLRAYGIHYEEKAGFDGVLSVPLHKSRFKERGFNQSAILAKGLAENLGLSNINAGLQRVKATYTQTYLSAGQRKSNVRKAFAVRDVKGVRDKKLLLIDDVMTTGATVNECARVLLEAGASSVSVLTLARGL